MSDDESVKVSGRRYTLVKELASGSVGDVHLAKDEDETEVAIKIQRSNSWIEDSPLLNEIDIYQLLHGEQEALGIPRFIWSGMEGEKDAFVMEAVGPNLQELLDLCGGKFTLKTVLMLADQMIRRVEYVHSKSIVHRDIKPEHFAMGLGEKSNTVYLMDFGISERYIDPETNKHVPCTVETTPPVGTQQYASRHSDRGADFSRRDDMESLGYVFIYLLKGELPWDNVVGINPSHERELVAEKKKNMPVEMLCEGLPKEFAQYMLYCRHLNHPKKPDYANLRTSFSGLMSKSDMQMDYNFDWVEPEPSTEEGEAEVEASTAPAETEVEAKAQDPDMKRNKE